ncbi:MAG: glycosyltransferase [Betaproteobacteria bacterium]|nr:glycosyltransferase [Betaproteobacteria bacterium]
MRLALVHQRYNAYGGNERLVSRALSALKANGTLDVTLIARRWDDDAGWHTRRVDPYSLTRIGRDRSFAKAAAACFHEYDVVQSHDRIPGATIFRAGDGVHASWLEQSRRVHGAGGTITRRLSGYDSHLLEAEAQMFAHSALKCVMCNSRMVADDIVHRFGVDEGRIALIYNGVDPALYNPGLVRHRAAWRQQHAVAADAPLLAYVGSGFAKRGVATALAAIAPFPEVHLAIAGTDKRVQRFVELAERSGLSNRVRFLGTLPNARPLYGAADAFILPSLYDPFPNACAEAFASGLPVFTSPTCGAAEWVHSRENGWVLDALDVEGYRSALSEWLRRRPDWPAMREAAHKAGEPYTLERMVRDLTALYQRLANPAPRLDPFQV